MLEPRRGAQQQHPGSNIPHDLESMRNFTRSENVGARTGLQPFAVANDRQLPLENVERLVFEMMRMIGRSKTRRHRPLLQQPERSPGVFSPGPYESGNTQ